MLKQRIITACILAPLAVLAVLTLPRAALAILAGVVLILAWDEWLQLARCRGLVGRILAGVLLTLVLLGLYWPAEPWLFRAVLIAGCLWWLVAMLWLANISIGAAPTRGNTVLKLCAGLFVVVPAWVALVWLHDHGAHGAWLLLALVLVWAADVGAYFAGSRFGKRKLAPRISPGKTWAGVAGAVALSLPLAALGGWLLQLPAAKTALLLLLTAVAVALSVVGDLTESLLKRQAMVKDSGRIFPGHGGLFDRVDSLCAFAPVFALGLWLLKI